MKRKYLAIALALLFTTAAFTMAFAEGEEGDGKSGAGTLMDMIIIDTAGVYEGMNMSYDSGYKPEIKEDSINIVLPLIINPSSGVQAVSGNQVKVVPNLGSATKTPFIFDGVHQQAFMLNGGQTGVEGGNAKTFFLLKLPIKLKAERSGGEYDISLAVHYTPEGEEGSITQYITFTVPVTAQGTGSTSTPTDNDNDGNDGQSPAPTDNNVDTGDGGDGGIVDYGSSGTGSGGGGGGSGTTTTPRLMLAEFSLSKDPIVAGEEFEISAVLKNTSTKAAVKNLIVTFSGETSDILTAEKTNSVFVKNIKADGSERVTMRMKVRLDAEPKPQKININIAGEDNNGAAVTDDLAIQVDIKQPTRLEYDEPNIQEEVSAGETISVSISLYNKGKGKLSNVMVKLDAPGLTPESSAFVGNMESGSSQVAELSVYVDTADMDGEDGMMDDGMMDDGMMDGGMDGEGFDEGLDVPETDGGVDMSAPDDETSPGPEESEGTSSVNNADAGNAASGAKAAGIEEEAAPALTDVGGGMAEPAADPDADGGEPDIIDSDTGLDSVDDMGDGLGGDEIDGGFGGEFGGEGGAQYGPTSGTLTITYEDAFGEEYSEEVAFSTNINEPMVPAPIEQEEPEPETAGQWWVSVLIAAGVIAAIAIALVVMNRRKKNRMTLEDDDY